MSGMDRYRITRKLTSIGVAIAVTMSLMPISAGSVYAEDSGIEYQAAAVQDSVAAEDVSCAEDVSAAEGYVDQGKTITADLSDDTDTEHVDIETEGFAASGEEGLSPDSILDVIVEADDGPEEDGIVNEEAVGTEETQGDDAEGAGPTLQETDQEDESAPGGGNVERVYIPYILEKMGVSLDDNSGDTDGILVAAGNVDYKAAGVIPDANYNITITQNGNTVTINGTVSGKWSFVNLWVDGTEVVKKFTGTQTKNLTNYSFNLNSYVGTGYHSVTLGVGSTDRKVDVIGKRYMACNTITDSPNSNGVFEVYSNYFNYYPYGSFGNSAGTLYMEYSANGGASWQRSGSMKYNLITTASRQGYMIDGLTEKTVYLTRICYGTYATYSKDFGGDDQSYFFSGPVLNTTTIKTGSSSKPRIKSVEMRATKVKHHKLRWPGYYNVVGGSVFWHSSYVEKFYTAKVKVTVKLKKKPGTAGVFISLLGQSKWVKGNKKKYTATFTPTYNYWVKNPHSGKYKLQVQVCSGQNSSWGGYSPVYAKKKKVR